MAEANETATLLFKKLLLDVSMTSWIVRLQD
jgi:hypothetical protein